MGDNKVEYYFKDKFLFVYSDYNKMKGDMSGLVGMSLPKIHTL